MTQAIKFLLNGFLLGILALVMQAAIAARLGGSDSAYTLASILTYAPLIVLNFAIQKKLIFSRPGRFWRFLAANLFIMVLVSAISPFCRTLLVHASNPEWGNRAGFLLAALIGAAPSFLLARYFVFNGGQGQAA